LVGDVIFTACNFGSTDDDDDDGAIVALFGSSFGGVIEFDDAGWAYTLQVKIAKIIIPRANNINGSCIANLN
jgi:hypothetical protein